MCAPIDSRPPPLHLRSTAGSGRRRVTSRRVDSSLTSADIADISSLGTAEINEGDLTVDAATTDGQSIEKIFMTGTLEVIFGNFQDVGTMRFFFSCAGLTTNEVTVSLATTQNNTFLALADDDTSHFDNDWDTGEAKFIEALDLNDDKVINFVYRSGSEVISGQFVVVDETDAVASCLMAGLALRAG